MRAADTAVATPRGQRTPLWDNARWLLLVLVVWGHLLNDLPTSSPLQQWAATWIYTFHIPALIFISGYFASRDLGKVVSTFWRLLAVWLTFEVIWSVFRYLVLGIAEERSFLIIPGWTLWYLVTLATLTLLLPVVVATRFPLVLSVLVSLTAGLLPAIGPQFSAARTAFLLPFFVLGWLCRTNGWLDRAWFARPVWWMRAIAAAALAIFGLAAWIFREPLGAAAARTWAAGYLSYDALLVPHDIPMWWGGIVRIGMLVVIVVVTTAFLLLVPRTVSAITPLGSRTLYIYLLHTFAILPILRAEWFETLSHSHRLTVAVTAVAAVVLSVLLASRPVVLLTRPIMEPSLRWLLSPADAKRARV